jgi:hypothetical protein
MRHLTPKLDMTRNLDNVRFGISPVAEASAALLGSLGALGALVRHRRRCCNGSLSPHHSPQPDVVAELEEVDFI